MFDPPRCPWPACGAHAAPFPGFYKRSGCYRPKCRSQPVPRFRCRCCGRSFSRQTFRHSYRDHKPHLNAVVFERLTAGGGMRELARRIPLTRRNLRNKLGKIAATLWALHRNRMRAFDETACFQLDELETFEHGRGTPLTLPILIETGSMFVVAAAAAPIRYRGRPSPERQDEIEAAEAREGRRRDRTRAGLMRVLRLLRPHVAQLPQVCIRTDQKACYGPLLRRMFGRERLLHERFPSRLPRTRRNPLFWINLTAAIARDLNARLRRRSWLVSKRRAWLVRQLGLFVVYRNYIRVRFAREEPGKTPAMRLGFTRRRLGFAQCLSWRQDWGPLSVDVESRGPRVREAA